MKSFLFLFLLSLRIPKNTFCQWAKNLRQLLSSIFVGVDSYQPRIKGVPGYDVSRLWVPSVWSVRTIIPSVSLFPSTQPPARLSRGIGKTRILGLVWSVISTSVSQPARQANKKCLHSEDWDSSTDLTAWLLPGSTQCRRRSKSESEPSSSVSVWDLWCAESWRIQSELKINDLTAVQSSPVQSGYLCCPDLSACYDIKIK